MEKRRMQKMSLTYVHDYKNDAALRGSFNELTREVFGFDFEDWYRQGYWGDQYRCFSLADNGRIVANASASTFNFVVEGEPRKAVQIGTVMSHPDYRGQGLAARLMATVLEEHEGKCDFMFLFANDTVLNFYPRFGFQRHGQNAFTVPGDAYSAGAKELRRLNLSRAEDMALLQRLTAARVPVSKQFGVSNDQWILMFYLTGPFAKHIWYLPEEDIGVIMQHKEDVLHVYDILSLKEVTQKSVFRQVVPQGTKSIRLHFTPDGSIPGVEVTEWQSEDGLFIRPATFKLPREFTIPALSIT
jgi:predicted N-acetyltransferase YhbS